MTPTSAPLTRLCRERLRTTVVERLDEDPRLAEVLSVLLEESERAEAAEAACIRLDAEVERLGREMESLHTILAALAERTDERFAVLAAIQTGDFMAGVEPLPAPVPTVPTVPMH